MLSGHSGRHPRPATRAENRPIVRRENEGALVAAIEDDAVVMARR